MATIQLPVEEITGEARQVRLSRVALTLFLGLFWIPGWLAGHAATGIILAAGHAATGIILAAVSFRRGWRDARGFTPP